MYHLLPESARKRTCPPFFTGSRPRYALKTVKELTVPDGGSAYESVAKPVEAEVDLKQPQSGEHSGTAFFAPPVHQGHVSVFGADGAQHSDSARSSRTNSGGSGQALRVPSRSFSFFTKNMLAFSFWFFYMKCTPSQGQGENFVHLRTTFSVVSKHLSPNTPIDALNKAD